MFADWMAAPAVPLTRLSIARDHDDPAGRLVDGEADQGGVGAEHVGRSRELALGQQVHERLVGVGLLPGGAHRRRGHARRRASPSRWRGCPAHIGTSTGVNETVTFVAAGRGEVLPDLGGVPVAAADGVRRRPSRGSRWPAGSASGLLPAPEGPTASTATRSSASITPAVHAGGEPEGDRGDVAAGNGDALRAGQPVALRAPSGEHELGQAVGPGAEELAAVERRPVGLAGQPVVGTAVDDEGAVAELRR